MSITLDRILAAAPTTARGQPTPISVDKKGERIAYASGKSIFVRSIDNPADCKQYTGHTVQTTVARFAPSGFYVASGDVSGRVRVWNAIGAENTKGEYSIISGRINDIAWDGDSQRIIAVGDGRERFGHCFTADSGNSVGELVGHSKTVNAVAIRQQRPLRAATVSDDGSMCFMHGVPFKFNSKADNLHRGFVFATAFSPDGSKLVTVGADKRIQLYDGKTGEPTTVIGEGAHTGSIFAVSWSEDGTKLVTSSADQTVRLWDADTGAQIQSWRLGPEGSVSVSDQQVGVVFPHGRTDGLIITLSLSGDLTYLKVGTAEPVKVVQGHNKSVTAVTAGSASDKAAWTGSFEGRVCKWDLTTGAGRVVDGSGHSNRVAAFSSRLGQSHTIAWDDTLRCMDEAAGTFIGEAIKLNGQPQGLSADSANGAVYVALASEALAIYQDGKLIGEAPLGYMPTAVAAAGNTLAVSGDGSKVNVYDVEGAKLTKVIELTHSTAAVSVLAFSYDGTLLATGNSAGKVIVYKAGGDWAVATDRWSAHTARVTSIAWNAESSHAVSGSLDSSVYLWSLEKPGNRISAANAHKDGVHGVAWVEGDSKIISSGADAALKLWNFEL
ncbi:putative WD repeat-containing protein C9G1.05 [Ceratocystis platani]|uniref:Putative WD repeat-containing protein C9G1.05 n=1 Tax=Ceratocystis fimbriata f. sp. platani TaxID=88771 RepID=A0A0F8DGY8_CERFI|nr:putative WD repeat-containing protein C9G1.05 [Ceratocystis platani]